MPKLIFKQPKYRRHKPSGQACVTLNGTVIYLGKHNSPESKNRYQREIQEWKSRGCQPAHGEAFSQNDQLTVTQLVDSFWEHAQTYYRRVDGTPTREAENFKPPLGILVDLYGDISAVDVGKIQLKVMRDRMISMNWCRNVVNAAVRRIKHLFAWAEYEGLIENSPQRKGEKLVDSKFKSLTQVKALRPGRSKAPETKRVRSVPDEIIHATLPHVSEVIQGMILFGRYTGARPAEICSMRIGEIDRTKRVWRYTPEHHKTAHEGKSRTVHIGPKAQSVLLPFLRKLDAAAFVFSPRDAVEEMRQRRASKRKTPLSCGNRPGSNISDAPEHLPGASYSTASFLRAVYRGCDLAFPAPPEIALEAAKLKAWQREHRPPREIRRDAAKLQEWRREHTPPPEIMQYVAKLAEWNREHRWHPNRLRHSFASKTKREIGLEIASVLMGHASTKTTEIYTQGDEDDDASAVEGISLVG